MRREYKERLESVTRALTCEFPVRLLRDIDRGLILAFKKPVGHWRILRRELRNVFPVLEYTPSFLHRGSRCGQ